MKNSSLARKTLLVLTTVFVLLAIATTASSAWRTRSNLTAEYASKGTALANNIASSSVELFLFRDSSTIQAMIDEILSIRGVAYVYVVDPQGEALAHTFSPAIPDELRTLEGVEGEAKIRELSIPGFGEFLDVSSPILAGKIGRVHVGMDRKLIRDAIWSAVAKQALLLTPIYLLSLLAAYAAMQRIVHPLNRLTATANEVTHRVSTSTGTDDIDSDDEIRIISGRRDEIGQLAGAFQEMICKVASREADLRTAHDYLETRVVQRTAELERANASLHREIEVRERTELALTRTARELGHSNTELERFAYIASHDLQEPLRKIQSFGDLLAVSAGPALNDTGRLYLERMKDASGRMRQLIDDLLNLARVTSKAKPFVEVDLARIAREVLSDLEGRIKLTAGHVDMGELPTLECDPTQMRQLLQNLIGNALKFHRPGVPPIVRVRSRLLAVDDASENCSLGEPTCEIEVRDNGIGFDEKDLDRIFTPFQRLHDRSEYEGTGMGLAICRKIVERHGGTITARSTPGQECTFIVRLPLKHPTGSSSHS